MEKKQEKGEFYFYQLRKNRPQRIYLSKEFPFISFKRKVFDKKRYIKKVILNKQDAEFVRVDGEMILRASLVGATQVRVIVYSNSNEEGNTMSFTLQKFRELNDGEVKAIIDSSFTFTQNEWYELLQFLNELQFINLKDKERFHVEMPLNPRKITLNLNKNPSDKEEKFLGEEIANILQNLEPEQRKILVELSQNRAFTKNELDILSGRKQGLNNFKDNLDSDLLAEKDWQAFFENNSWIFGYGLDYKFLKILQREANVSDSTIDGKETVISDYLLSDNKFTTLVELKKPNTPLFDNQKNRSRSWRLSNDLTWAVSQILTQKAEWEIKSTTRQYDKDGDEIRELTVDPKTILIIGHSNQFQGTDKTNIIKAKTFELYRRNLRNIEILTFDELYQRANYIINNDEKVNDEKNEAISFDKVIDDDLPF